MRSDIVETVGLRHDGPPVREQLSNILDHIEILNELDTTGVQPMAHVTGLENVMRDDVVVTGLPREAVLANAPDEEDGYFKVPPVLEE
ncbi:MAG: Asp-tRNA(Asn)/Glu-tRNA(Gln) amidotransferase subunit GatC [Anoxybacillus ayderensis]|nr:Asp-tRNA(Asn)/Glu-tRNA(Gln) amidotransferase subunit GatC [Anoxybacillus ayderensis]